MNVDIDSAKGLDIRQFTDVIPLANQSTALEFLLTVKSGIRSYAISLTECATPEVRTVVRRQLFEALDIHEKLSNLMISKGWLHPWPAANVFTANTIWKASASGQTQMKTAAGISDTPTRLADILVDRPSSCACRMRISPRLRFLKTVK